MKEIILKQYIEARRVVAVRVEDDENELDAAKKLDEVSLDNEKLPDGMDLKEGWIYISDTGIEDVNGNTVMYEDEEDVDRG